MNKLHLIVPFESFVPFCAFISFSLRPLPQSVAIWHTPWRLWFLVRRLVFTFSLLSFGSHFRLITLKSAALCCVCITMLRAIRIAQMRPYWTAPFHITEILNTVCMAQNYITFRFSLGAFEGRGGGGRPSQNERVYNKNTIIINITILIMHLFINPNFPLFLCFVIQATTSAVLEDRHQWRNINTVAGHCFGHQTMSTGQGSAPATNTWTITM